MPKVKVIHPQTKKVVEVNHPSMESMRWKRASAAKAEREEEAESKAKEKAAKKDAEKGGK